MADRIASSNGRAVLIAQDDGNLVLYHDGTPVWASNTMFDPDDPGPPPNLDTPPLVIEGAFFRQTAGARWTAIECSDFNLLNRWQHGEDITPQLAQRARCGFNLLRVWTLYDLEQANIGRFLDIDYARVPEFLALCASYGLYVEFVAYTSLERPDHWERLVAATQGLPNVLRELVNEGTLIVNQIDMNRYARPNDGVPTSHGSGGSEGIPPWAPWDYVTFHTNGASEEQRKVGHNCMELADMWGVPALTNETSRYPDVGMWVGADLDRQVQLAYDSAAGASLLCAGSCFHSVQGKTSELWDAQTERVARAWAAGALSIATSCQPKPYRRRDDLLTDDLLRVYQRGDDGCLVAIHK